MDRGRESRMGREKGGYRRLTRSNLAGPTKTSGARDWKWVGARMHGVLGFVGTVDARGCSMRTQTWDPENLSGADTMAATRLE
ncbi:hypothetical protein TIFTF001_008068 [Ficus carica]|uniref:Uncharacterized protein n=1 Tax=Ficus carica TaxID=3494 RepID=A0AA88D091_FICCA|nr:hypothetical protein TIFTF001_008068 [Ficus carica]